MAPLPTALDLGGVPSARTGRPIATIDTSAIGRGVQQFGQAVQAVGLDLKAKHDQTAAFEAERKLQEFMFNERSAAVNAITNMQPGGTGFSGSYLAGYQERANAFAQQNFATLTPEARQELNGRIFGLGQQLFFDTADAERTEITRYNLNALGDVLSTLKTQIDMGGVDTLEEYQAEGERLINASALSPIEKTAQIEKWREGAASVAWEAQLRNDPQGALQALGFEPRPVTDVGGFQPQFQSNLDRFLADAPAGVTIGSGYRTPERQRQLWDAKVADVAEMHPDWSRERIEEEADNWVARPGGSRHEFGLAADLQFASPEARAWAHENAAKYGLVFPMSHEPWHVELQGARDGTGGGAPTVTAIDPRFQNIGFEERDRLLRAATPVINEMRRTYMAEVDNTIAFLRDGGDPASTGYNTQQAASIMGPEAAAEIAVAMREAADFGRTVNALAFATPEELNTVANEAANRLLSPENYVENKQRFDNIQAAIEQRRDDIKADPAAYVMRQETVGGPYDALAEALNSDDEETLASAPGLANAYAVASLNEQARLGVPEDMRTILSEAHRDAIVSQFTNQEEGGENAAQLMRGLQEQWGRHWPKVYEELVKNGNLPDVAVVVGAMDREDQRIAAGRLAEASTIGQTELDKMIPEDRRTYIRDNLGGKMNEFIATIQGMPGRDILRYTDAVKLLATSYATSENGDTALNKAYEDILGVAYQFREHNGGSYRIPAERDGDRVGLGADLALVALRGGGPYYFSSMLGDVDEIAGSPMTARLDIPPSGMGLSPDEERAAYLSHLQSARWRTNADETGLALWRSTDNAVVTIDGGTPLTITWDELEGLAALYRYGTPRPTAPVTPAGPPVSVLDDPMRAGGPLPGSAPPAAPWTPPATPAPPASPADIMRTIDPTAVMPGAEALTAEETADILRHLGGAAP